MQAKTVPRLNKTTLRRIYCWRWRLQVFTLIFWRRSRQGRRGGFCVW